MQYLKIKFLADAYYSPNGAETKHAKAGEVVMVRERTAMACVTAGLAQLYIPEGFVTKEEPIDETLDDLGPDTLGEDVCTAVKSNGETCGRVLPCRYHKD